MPNRLMFSALVVLAACGSALAGDGPLDDFIAPYLQRLEGITPGAGNAKDLNAATHVIDPWHRYTGDPRIPGNGERMVGAIERYRDVRKLREAPPPITPTPISPSGLSTSATTPTSTTATSTATTGR